MPFTLPDLPYAKDALAPHMSAETLEFHHGKHHRAYVTKTNDLATKAGLEGKSLVEVVKAAKGKGDKKLFNNAAQLWNHSFFWQCLTPAQGQKPEGKLAQRIERDFGSVDALLEKLGTESTEHFSNGWGWLVLDGETLKVTSLHDADTPLVHGLVPLFTLDVWEHAYYIDYRNERPKFAAAVLKNIVNWEFVAKNLDGKGSERADQPATAAREKEATA
ncbi:superoxide dismutase [Sphingomonas sp.]|uniref:superoxide dismutase n=1 Tax=Sphingomonas sp. TaxID=28214 RepID=UPI00286D873B|nr:superoxide dismutase [Sphingomonas sp.]